MAPGKVCVVCGIDVSSVKRVKDPHGNYYCQVCYDAKLADRRARATGDPEVDFQCHTCQRFFAVEDVYDEGGTIICKSCFAARTRPQKKAASSAGSPVEALQPVEAAPPVAAPTPPVDDIPMLEPIDEPAAPAYEPPPTYSAPVPVARPVEDIDNLEVIPDEAPPAPGMAAATATGSAVWHVHDRGQPQGPMSEPDLVAGCLEGRFSTAAQIWKDGMDGWQPIYRIESLLGRAV